MTDYGYTPKKDELVFLPLGGANEIGMNLNLYHFNGKWLMVDLGVTFGDDTTPGIDVILPDPRFIEAHRKNLLGVLITHGHEDHIGAIPHLCERLECPVYASPFAGSLIRRKLSEANLSEKVELIEIPISKKFELGPFGVEFISLTHSIPEPNSILLTCGDYSVFHTGDWKFDNNPQVGNPTDYSVLEKLSSRNITAMVGDSTNVDVMERTGSEAELIEPLHELFAKQTGRIAIACFASNVARLRTIALTAEANDRHTALVGRSLWRMYEVAKENGYLLDVPEFLSDKDVGYLPNDKIVMICTGSQGEPRAALSRIADSSHPQITLNSGDTLIFSSREIPGNETAIGRIKSNFIAQGVKIITEKEAHVHVSGHPGREDMIAMYQLIKPKISVPVHGEGSHLAQHAELARSCQVPDVVIPRNGSAIKLAPGLPEEVALVPISCLGLDGNRVIELNGKIIKERKKLVFSGIITVTLILNKEALCQQNPIISAVGVYEDAETQNISLDKNLKKEIDNAPQRKRTSDEGLKEFVQKTLKRIIRSEYGKKPIITIHLVRN